MRLKIKAEMPVENMYGYQIGTAKEAVQTGNYLFMVNDEARGRTSFGQNGSVYADSEPAHEGDDLIIPEWE